MNRCTNRNILWFLEVHLQSKKLQYKVEHWLMTKAHRRFQIQFVQTIHHLMCKFLRLNIIVKKIWPQLLSSLRFERSWYVIFSRILYLLIYTKYSIYWLWLYWFFSLICPNKQLGNFQLVWSIWKHMMQEKGELFREFYHFGILGSPIILQLSRKHKLYDTDYWGFFSYLNIIQMQVLSF